MACLAGSPRQLWEISLDQNLQALGNPQTLPAELEAELEKAKDIQGLDAEDTLFGMGAAYVQDLDLHPAQASLDRLNLPIAIFQGGEDFQVGEKDYAAWEQALQSYAGRSEFHYYPELNHLFVAGTTKEEGLVRLSEAGRGGRNPAGRPGRLRSFLRAVKGAQTKRIT